MEEVRHDRLTPALVARLAALLDREPLQTDFAPQGIHWCLTVPETPTHDLGQDGHPATGEVAPRRRMWAASSVRFLAPLRIGSRIERRSRIADHADKPGSSGRLTFVTLAHLVTGDGEPAVEETQTLVYREPPPAGTAMARAPTSGNPSLADRSWHRTVVPSATLLFRYSALTFNSHRIHYDLAYAREAEGYPALVVQGPLLATLLLDLAARELGPNRLAAFNFRAVRPSFADEAIALSGRRNADTLDLTVENALGETVMSANAIIG